jgi:hypothetical protein
MKHLYRCSAKDGKVLDLELEDTTVSRYMREIGDILACINRRKPFEKPPVELQITNTDRLKLKIIIVSFEAHKSDAEITRFEEPIRMIRALAKEAETEDLRIRLEVLLSRWNLIYDWYSAVELECYRVIEGFSDYMKEGLVFDRLN